jgi:hypothetical protein
MLARPLAPDGNRSVHWRVAVRKSSRKDLGGGAIVEA